jgi:hypothetical protein
MDANIIIIGSAAEFMGLQLATERLIAKLDALCIAKLEAQVVEFTCPDIDVPPLPYGNCCGPWEVTIEQALTPLDLSRLKQQLTLPERVEQFKEATRKVVAPTPYPGYANARHGRRRNW